MIEFLAGVVVATAVLLVIAYVAGGRAASTADESEAAYVDAVVYGTGVLVREPDGRIVRVDPRTVTVRKEDS